MGGSASKRPAGGNKSTAFGGRILDNFKSLTEVQSALRAAGLESSDLIVGIDFTKSNTWTGERSFGGRSLHALLGAGALNPYQRAISVIGRTLEAFDDDNLIPAFGFGDRRTTDLAVFPLDPAGAPCRGFEAVLARYAAAAATVHLSGPTSFVPLVRRGVEVVAHSGAYHILLVVADGQVSNRQANIDAIVEASRYALSIVMVGVGDGPWDDMVAFDDELPARQFDNFQFVEMERVCARHGDSDAAFALAALMEIPEQYKAIRSLGLLGKTRPLPAGWAEAGASLLGGGAGVGEPADEVVAAMPPRVASVRRMSAAADPAVAAAAAAVLREAAGERRRDRDGGMYTRAEFVAHYGTDAQWHAAAVAPTMASPLADSAGAQMAPD